MKETFTFEQLKGVSTIPLNGERNVLINNVSLFDIDEVTVHFLDHDLILLRFLGSFGKEVASISIEENQRLEVDGAKLTVL
jgi:hypothetical protein